MSNSLSSNTGAFGFAYNFNPDFQLNIGALYTMYDESDKNFSHYLGKTAVPVIETYDKGNLIVSVGVDFSFGK